MDKDFYPSLYNSANRASLLAQRAYLILIQAFIGLTILGTTLSAFITSSTLAGIFATIFFLSTLFITIYQAFRRFDRTWYNGRALAESIKTRTWRFVMRAEPYEEDEPFTTTKKEFIDDLRKIFQQNKDLGSALLSQSSSEENITAKMISIRAYTHNQRLEFYLENRVKEQRNWYHEKARYNKRMERNWFIALVFFHVVVIVLLLFQIGYKLTGLPIETFIIIVSSILTWTQVKKYQDLATSYSLTEHEISILQSQRFLAEPDEEALSDYVKDAENAFSREHTQWVARKDT